MVIYEDMLFKRLKMPPNFLDRASDQNRGDRVLTNRELSREKLLSAARAMRGPEGELFAIQLFIHTATKIVLLYSEDSDWEKTVKAIEKDPKSSGIDPVVVITDAALFYLLDNYRLELERQCDESQSGDDEITSENRKSTEKDLELIRHAWSRLDQMNWLMNYEAKQHLFSRDSFQAR